MASCSSLESSPFICANCPINCRTEEQNIPTGFVSFDQETIIEVGDDVVIIHRGRRYRKQFGVIGRIIKTTTQFVTLRTATGTVYTKKRSNVAKLVNPIYNERVPN